MDIVELPAFTVLREKMSFLAQRQKVLSQNVANASTPGYMPEDLNTGAFNKALAAELGLGGGAVTVARTSILHQDMNDTRTLDGEFRAKPTPDTDMTMDGNAVVLEDQMLKVSETRGEYETMVAIYQRALGMMRTAIKAVGR